MVNLLPCPFCGGTNISESWDEVGQAIEYCDDCGACGPPVMHRDGENVVFEPLARAKAIELWNLRAAYWLAATGT